MDPALPAEQMAVADSHGFEVRVSSYAQQLSNLLRENPWAFWQKRFWTYGHWARRDSELQKILARTYGLLHEYSVATPAAKAQATVPPEVAAPAGSRLRSAADPIPPR